MKTISQIPERVRKKNGAETRFRTARLKSRLGLRDVAKFSGVSLATVQRIDTGRPPSIEVALKLARFFERSVEVLFAEWAD